MSRTHNMWHLKRCIQQVKLIKMDSRCGPALMQDYADRLQELQAEVLEKIEMVDTKMDKYK